MIVWRQARGVMAQLSNNKLTGRAGADGHNGAMTWPYSASALRIARCKQVALWGLSALPIESAVAVQIRDEAYYDSKWIRLPPRRYVTTL